MITVEFTTPPLIDVIFSQKQDISVEFQNGQGPSGVKGENGKSAYELYVEGGGTLIEEDYIRPPQDYYNRAEIDGQFDALDIYYVRQW